MASRRAMTAARSKSIVSLRPVAERVFKNMVTKMHVACSAGLPCGACRAERDAFLTAESFNFFIKLDSLVRGFAAATVVRRLRSNLVHYIQAYACSDDELLSLFAAAAGVAAGEIADSEMQCFSNLVSRFVKCGTARQLRALRARIVKTGSAVRETLRAGLSKKK